MASTFKVDKNVVQEFKASLVIARDDGTGKWVQLTVTEFNAGLYAGQCGIILKSEIGSQVSKQGMLNAVAELAQLFGKDKHFDLSINAYKHIIETCSIIGHDNNFSYLAECRTMGTYCIRNAK